MVAQVVKDAIHEGLPITAETCPHYLGFTEDFVFEKGAPAKCTPPMRNKEAMEKLWDYVLDGTLSCIGSDHSPAADEEKDNATKDIWHAWGGLNSIQFFLPMMFDMVVHKKGLQPKPDCQSHGLQSGKSLRAFMDAKERFELWILTAMLSLSIRTNHGNVTRASCSPRATYPVSMVWKERALLSAR